MRTNRCYLCKKTKPLKNFYRNQNKENGHCDECKQCDSKRLFKYRGPSPGRTQAQGFAYTGLPFLGKHLVLAGQGENIRMLKEWNVPETQIVAIDTDRACLVPLMASTLCAIIHGNVGVYLRKMDLSVFESINLDFCFSAKKALPFVLKAVERAPHARIMVTFSPSADRRARGNRRTEDEVIEDFCAALRAIDCDPKVFKYSSKGLKKDGRYSTGSRMVCVVL